MECQQYCKKVLGTSGTQELLQIWCEIQESGNWQTDCLELIMIPTESKQQENKL